MSFESAEGGGRLPMTGATGTLAETMPRDAPRPDDPPAPGPEARMGIGMERPLIAGGRVHAQGGEGGK
jgi:hypothetical protein